MVQAEARVESSDRAAEAAGAGDASEEGRAMAARIIELEGQVAAIEASYSAKLRDAASRGELRYSHIHSGNTLECYAS